MFMPGRYQQNAIQPGSHDPLGNLGIWANDMEAKGFADWVDDPDAGLFSRKLYAVTDALGAKGWISGVPYAFGAVLQIGQNVVIYQLNNPDTGEYIVYGFPIDLVDAVRAMARYLRRVAEKKNQLSIAVLGSMADRILERFPTDEAALFNKGVVFISEERFAEAHECFERALGRNSNDQLTLLYDAAALAGMGRHEGAMAQFAKADSISEEWVCKNISMVGILPKHLSVSVSELMCADPGNQRYADLWSKYFPSIPIRN
jgi:tetratricopeptide (TPR) repeat protein